MQPKAIHNASERCNLRLSEDVMTAIDTARAQRPGFTSRNSWIAEAIEEKLAREGNRSDQQKRSANDA